MSTIPLWDEALAHRSATLANIKNLKVELPVNPVGDKNIGGLNAKLAQVRSFLNTVRDYIFDSQGLHIALRGEANEAADAYEEKLAEYLENFTGLAEDEKKKLPKTAEEREILFRKSCPAEYGAKKTTERRVEDWELYQKMLYTIYYSLRDTNEDISAQVAIIRQQYFSGEVQVDKQAKNMFDFLSEDAKQLFSSVENKRPGFELEVIEPDSMEAVL